MSPSDQGSAFGPPTVIVDKPLRFENPHCFINNLRRLCFDIAALCKSCPVYQRSHAPQGDHESITGKHPKLEMPLSILYITNPDPSLASLRYSFSHRLSRNRVYAVPNIFASQFPSLQRDTLNSNPALVLSARNGQVLAFHLEQP